MNAWAGEPDDYGCYIEPPDLTVELPAGPEVIGQLYGPTGELLGTVLDRKPEPFGFVKT